MNWKIWLLVPVIYGLFSFWYFNWQGPITPAEVEEFMQRFDESSGGLTTDRDTFRKFLEEDDGNEFVMMNQLQLIEGKANHPVTGENMSAAELANEYSEPFMRALMQRGGVPVFMARRVGGNIDSWNADQNLSFSAAAMMRYRSRRDIVDIALDPAFNDSHLFKLAAFERTISYPTQMLMSTSLRPPIAVLLVLMLLVSLAQNTLFLIKRRAER